ncbi:MAG: septum site-determining protein MinC [Desmonostoc vinosum HA7617-LM4]|jgi:septum site-determining protein MinC|nr:septum site-determining protein MinC [Desmonostoc vinosum HA7617-LM4]
MTYDSAMPDLKSNSALPNAESNSTTAEDQVNSHVSDGESDSIFPEAELRSVLRYLKSNATLVEEESDSTPANEGLISANSDADYILTNANANESQLAQQKSNQNIQVQFKTEEGRLLLILPTESQVPASEVGWTEIWQQIKQRLNASDRLRKANTAVHLLAQDRLLDSRQLQELAETLNKVQFHLTSVATSRRQTAIAAVTSGYSVEQLQPKINSISREIPIPLADALYLEMTVRSGVEIRHPGTVILLGDLNPGGIVVADGDILIWGRLRGIAHAGAGGNRECLIMALQMEPTQLRIADAVARAPEKSPTRFSPEVAHITPKGIRIAKATDFSRNQLTRINQEP